MALINREDYFETLKQCDDQIAEDSTIKSGMKIGLRLAMNRLAETTPIWEHQDTWNRGMPRDDGRYIINRNGCLMEGILCKGVMYHKRAGKLILLTPDRYDQWVRWPKEGGG